LAPIVRRESGGNPWVGYTSKGEPLVDLSGRPLDDTGLPQWEGRMGPKGISHAAGLFQFQPGTWRPIARELGVKDFSVESQWKVARELYRREGLRPWAASAPPGGDRAAAGERGNLVGLFTRIDQMGLAPEIALKTKDLVRVNYNALEAMRSGASVTRRGQHNPRCARPKTKSSPTPMPTHGAASRHRPAFRQ
jgi:hypothetical protein